MQIYFPIKSIPDFNGAAIYCLIDDNGKRYIGSSKHLYNRIKQHEAHMRSCKKNGRDGFLNSKIEKAINEGITFTCEILEVFENKITRKELESIEKFYIGFFGGISKTYNMQIIKKR